MPGEKSSKIRPQLPEIGWTGDEHDHITDGPEGTILAEDEESAVRRLVPKIPDAQRRLEKREAE